MITATLVGAGDPRDVQIVVSEVPAGASWRVTGHAGDWSWIVPGGEGVGDGGQVVLLDNRAPGNVPVTYRVETSAGVLTETNLFTNPRLVGSGTWAEVQKNYLRAPLLSSAYPGWALNPFYTYTAIPGVGREAVATANISTAEYLAARQHGVDPGAGPGETWSVGFEVSNTGSLPFTVYAGANSSDGTANLATPSGPDVVIAPGETKAVQANGVVTPAGTTNVRAILFSRSMPSGAKFVILDGPVTMRAPSASANFSGVTKPAGLVQPEDFRTRWLGAVNGSESVLEIETVRGMSGTACIPGVSTKAGKPAVRVIPTSTSATTHVQITGALTPAPGDVRVMATATLDAPQAGSLDPEARRVTINTASFGTFRSAQAATSGTTQLRVTSTGRTGPDLANVRLYNGAAAGGGDVWWTDIALVPGTYTGPAFSGATPDTTTHQYDWAGTVDNSASHRYSLVQETTPMVVPMTSGMVLQSLDGTQVVPVKLMDGSGDITHESRQARFAVSRRRTPVIRYDVTGSAEGALSVEISMTHSRDFQRLIETGEPVVWRAGEDLRDLPPVQVISYGQLSSIAVLHSWPPEGFRAWQIPYIAVDDPILDMRLGSAAWNEFDTLLVGMTWDQFDARFAGMSWDELDRFDWANL